MRFDGSCHCGAVTYRVTRCDGTATTCNCTVCRRYGVLWAYDHEGEGISVSGPTTTYVRGDREIGFHFCATCGCVAFWRSLAVDGDGRRRIAVNVRLADPAAVADMPIRIFDGLTSFADLPPDGRQVRHLWS